MPSATRDSPEPAESRVSILLPTYNRAAFLPAAFDAIRSQTFEDWALVVVDDGSTDETARVVDGFRQQTARPVAYVRQENAGPYAARNRALDFAAAPYVAFYDSDDVWLPHHLSACVAALDTAPDVDWVYGASRVLDLASGRTLDPDTFLDRGTARPFRRLRTRRVDGLHVIDDPRVVACAAEYGLYCGLQNSVMRRQVFDAGRFRTAYRNEAEDQLFAIRALKRGVTLGYLDAVHVQYQVHEANSSASAVAQSVDRRLAVHRPIVRGFEELRTEYTWLPAERRALARRLSRDYFWRIGYAVLWQDGRRVEALEAFRSGLRHWPWSPACWKTYALARLRTALG